MFLPRSDRLVSVQPAPSLVMLLHFWIRRFFMIIFDWWFQLSSKIYLRKSQ